MPTLSASHLSDFAVALLTAGGIPADPAKVVADSLVGANLRGHDSHGVMRIPSYLDRIREGRVHPEQTLTVLQESPCSLAGDGNWGLGQVVMHALTERLIAKAQTSAIACGTLRQVAHIGRLGEYAERAAEQGLVTLIMANMHGSGQRVAPPGGIRPRLGTNPICLGAPGGEHGPFVFDIGTSATAEGKVRVKKIAGETVPPGWLLDPDGNPTTDPNQLYGNPPGSILPLGGDQAYKGFGLAFMIEILSGGLSGGPCAMPDAPPPMGNCVWMTLVNPVFFGGVEHFRTQITQLESYVRDVPRKGTAPITLPGDPERATLAHRQQQGIPLDVGNWRALVALAEQLSVAVPAVE